MLLVLIYIVALAVFPLTFYPPDVLQISMRPLLGQSAAEEWWRFSIDPGIPRGLPGRPRYKSSTGAGRGLTGVDFGHEEPYNMSTSPVPLVDETAIAALADAVAMHMGFILLASLFILAAQIRSFSSKEVTVLAVESRSSGLESKQEEPVASQCLHTRTDQDSKRLVPMDVQSPNDVVVREQTPPQEETLPAGSSALVLDKEGSEFKNLPWRARFWIDQASKAAALNCNDVSAPRDEVLAVDTVDCPGLDFGVDELEHTTTSPSVDQDPQVLDGVVAPKQTPSPNKLLGVRSSIKKEEGAGPRYALSRMLSNDQDPRTVDDGPNSDQTPPRDEVLAVETVQLPSSDPDSGRGGVVCSSLLARVRARARSQAPPSGPQALGEQTVTLLDQTVIPRAWLTVNEVRPRYSGSSPEGEEPATVSVTRSSMAISQGARAPDLDRTPRPLFIDNDNDSEVIPSPVDKASSSDFDDEDRAGAKADCSSESSVVRLGSPPIRQEPQAQQMDYASDLHQVSGLDSDLQLLQSESFNASDTTHNKSDFLVPLQMHASVRTCYQILANSFSASAIPSSDNPTTARFHLSHSKSYPVLAAPRKSKRHRQVLSLGSLEQDGNRTMDVVDLEGGSYDNPIHV